MDKKELAQIPYIVHELRMHKAHDKRKRLRRWLIGTNLMWLGIVILLMMR